MSDQVLSPSSIAMPSAVQALLKRSGAMHTPHTGRVLHDHLLGTYRQLEAWGNAESICMAGLFHSIYGTNAFTHQSLRQTQRTELQQAIGPEAEALAWLFCRIDRPRAILQGIHTCKPAGSIQIQARRAAANRMSNVETLTVTYPQLQAMAEIECANLIEQGSWGSALRELYCAAVDRASLLSDAAVTALRTGWEQQLQTEGHQRHQEGQVA